MVLSVLTVRDYLHPELHPQLGVVNLNGILERKLESIKGKQLGEQEITKQSQNFALAMDASLKYFAEEYHLKLIVGNASATGFEDYTALLEKDIEQRIKRMER
jgi:hypothetical protein